MSRSAIGFVATSNKDVFFVVSLIERAINKVVSARFNPFDGDCRFAFAQAHVNADSGFVQMHFTHEGKRLVMFVFFDTDGDRRALTPHSINLNMGSGPEANLYIDAALQALAVLGPVFFRPDDSVSERFEEILHPRMSFIESCGQGLAVSSSLLKWVAQYRSATLRVGSTEQVLGFDDQKLERLLAMGPLDQCSCITTLVEDMLVDAI
jgi:hypothetical protein